jgi:hypothetical protein
VVEDVELNVEVAFVDDIPSLFMLFGRCMSLIPVEVFPVEFIPVPVEFIPEVVEFIPEVVEFIPVPGVEFIAVPVVEFMPVVAFLAADDEVDDDG